jgi:hypothetical protein
MKISRCKKVKSRAEKRKHKIHNKGMAQKYADRINKGVKKNARKKS